MANYYGKKVGFHTPKMSEINKHRIERDSGIQFEDSCWHNDLCDSLLNEELDIKIMLPNSANENPDQEEFNTFTLTRNESTEQIFSEPMSYEELIKELIKYN